MQLMPTALDGVFEIQPRRFGDQRGWFSESWNSASWAEAGLDLAWVQDNESFSSAAGTVRGIHFQTRTAAQDKLVRVIAGRILDVAVDLRRSSKTFGCYVGVELSAKAGNQLLVPRGFGHGFATLEPDCHVLYKVTGLYDKTAEAAVHWQDSTLAIDWGIAPIAAVVSDKDAVAPSLADADHLLFD